MSQLRDVKTGELVFEGTPLECVLVAEELGGAAVSDLEPGAPADAELVYDDVGLGFDADAVLRAHKETVDGLAAAAKDAKPHTEQREQFTAALDEAKAAGALDRSTVEQAADALERARQAQDNAG